MHKRLNSGSIRIALCIMCAVSFFSLVSCNSGVGDNTLLGSGPGDTGTAGNTAPSANAGPD